MRTCDGEVYDTIHCVRGVCEERQMATPPRSLAATGGPAKVNSRIEGQRSNTFLGCQGATWMTQSGQEFALASGPVAPPRIFRVVRWSAWGGVGMEWQVLSGWYKEGTYMARRERSHIVDFVISSPARQSVQCSLRRARDWHDGVTGGAS